MKKASQAGIVNHLMTKANPNKCKEVRYLGIVFMFCASHDSQIAINVEPPTKAVSEQQIHRALWSQLYFSNQTKMISQYPPMISSYGWKFISHRNSYVDKGKCFHI